MFQFRSLTKVINDMLRNSFIPILILVMSLIGSTKLMAQEDQQHLACIGLLERYIVMTDEMREGKEISTFPIQKFIEELKTGDDHHDVHLRTMQQNLSKVKDDMMSRDKYIATFTDELVHFILSEGMDFDGFYVFHCPNTNENNGANWIDDQQEAHNPYVGPDGEGCGKLVGELNKELLKVFDIKN